jgi:hypothetical protein
MFMAVVPVVEPIDVTDARGCPEGADADNDASHERSPVLDVSETLSRWTLLPAGTLYSNVVVSLSLQVAPGEIAGICKCWVLV